MAVLIKIAIVSLWKICVRYRYEISGQHREGTRIADGYFGGSENAQRELYNKISQAEALTVRFGVISWGLTIMAISSSVYGAQYDRFIGIAIAILFVTLIVVTLFFDARSKDRITDAIEILANKRFHTGPIVPRGL